MVLQVHRALYDGGIPVAVKMLTVIQGAEHTDQQIKSFAAELNVMGKIRSPNIVRCYGGNPNPPVPFIVMELCEYSLAQVCGTLQHTSLLFNTLPIFWSSVVSAVLKQSTQ